MQIIRVLALSAVILGHSNAFAYGPYKATVLDIIDYDSAKLAINIWPGLVYAIAFDINNVKTLDPKGKHSKCETILLDKADKFTRRVLNRGSVVTVDLVELSATAGATGTIEIVGGDDFGQLLVKAGYAKADDDETPWCIEP